MSWLERVRAAGLSAVVAAALTGIVFFVAAVAAAGDVTPLVSVETAAAAGLRPVLAGFFLAAGEGAAFLAHMVGDSGRRCSILDAEFRHRRTF
jgi:hypothetical protein